MGDPALSTDPQDHWYVAFGSNTLDERFEAYLFGSEAASAYGHHEAGPDLRPPAEARWLEIDYPLYFAGDSLRWAGAVAFVSLARDRGGATVARAFRISAAQLVHVAKSENAVADFPWTPELAGVPVDRWVPLPVAGAGPQGKYNAALRLPDIDGQPAVTLTTARAYRAGVPGEAYRDVLRRGLSASGRLDDVDAYLDAAVARSRRMTAVGAPPPYNPRLGY